ncbi:MAG: hybrid sensor histidine kinase/response regulator [Desulfomonile tiedjei]|nr:hybrid sensor histidine kinase/response regulator [Desulfomonile tiedjei]
MTMRDDEFLKKLFEAFRIEADEHISAISNGLLELEKRPDDSEKGKIIETMYREAHSLKGASRSVNMTEIESVCQAIESIFSALKADRMATSTEFFDTLHRAVDSMRDLLVESDSVAVQPIMDELDRLEAGSHERAAAAEAGPPRPKAEAHDVASGETTAEQDLPVPNVKTVAPEDAAIDRSEWEGSPRAAGGAAEARAQNFSTSPKKERPQGRTDTVRISVDKLDPLLRQVGEMVSVKLTASQRVADIMSLMTVIDQWKQKWNSVSSQGRGVGDASAKRGGGGGDEKRLAKLMDFLDWNQSCIKTLEGKLKTLARSAESDSRMHGGMVDDLLEDMMNVLMLPCSSLLEVFPKLVRDLARDAGKEVDLEIVGGDLEIDRRILDEMKDPLIHLVRNCVDHGLERPDDRAAKGKQRQGTITMAISQISGNQIELVVSDDGAGIDVAKVREAAAKRGMVSEQDRQRLAGQDALALVFRSEISTSPIVSNISGRGLGLAIVREKVENLGGNISIATAAERGASFKILLPVTLATFRGILVHVGDQLVVIPTANVERVARIRRDLIKTVGNRDTIEVNGQAMPLVRLGDILELPRLEKRNGDSDFLPVMILRAAEMRVSFSVDSILQEQEVLVKPLGKQLARVRNVAGATVLGSGKLVPILNVPDLIKSAVKRTYAGSGPAMKIEQLEHQRKSVLVVEDSITSRMLLKNILESSGYLVTTTVDGVDAWTALKRDPFDLVVSDVEMPRMDGFQLTANIRGDEKLADLPVVLVTSLGSREDRERGIDVGANAYIVKGSFDQNNLLETVARLV